jgi:hypothetical protein
MLKLPSNSLPAVTPPPPFSRTSVCGSVHAKASRCGLQACVAAGPVVVAGGEEGSVYLNFPPIRKLDFVVLSDGRLYGLPIQSRP